MDLDEIKRGLRTEIKKRENEQYFTFQCNVRQMCKDVLAKLEEMDAAIAELKQKLEDAGMRERMLKRALWLTRAFRARDIQRWWIAATCSKTTERACSVWNNVERKCRAKAEQYK